MGNRGHSEEGVADYISEGVNAVTFSPKSVDEMTSVLPILCSSLPDRKTFASNNRPKKCHDS